MRRLFWIFFFATIYNLSFGQIEITVRVVDQATKKPIKNANVVILGTPKGTFTNAAGFFRLKLARAQKIILISHASYVTESIEVPGNVNSFTVALYKTDFMFPIDLREYPSNFDTTKFQKKEVKETNHVGETWTVVEALADYPGGLQGFKDYFGNNFKYPESELLKNTNGVTRLEFTIDKTGDYKDIRCLPDSVSEICDEFKRILTVIPKWIPAEQRGEKIDQEMAFPIWYGPNDYWKKRLKEVKKNKG
jgi:CarboxypepD_reg-like domain/Gram-negative bacterial TonB protein C-terminal